MIDVVVIGAGPTGIAALVEAGRLGRSAIAIEAGASPVASIAAYPEGLVLLSPAWNYEVGDLPLDCRDGGEVTREELLHYYTRVIRHARLAIRCTTRCTRLVPHDGFVEVHVDNGPPIEAGHVLVTAWYERRPATGALAGRPGVEVVAGLANGVGTANRRVVIIGGGMSAFEHATMLMLHGHALAVVARGTLAPFFSSPSFATLVDATGSSVIADAGELAVVDGGVRWQDGFVPADLVVACLGAQLSPAIANLVIDAGVMDRELVDRIAAAPTPEQLARRGERRDRALDERPDLWRHVVDGVRRVHVAGGIVHTGGSDAGVLCSSRSAVVAMRAIAGVPPDDLAPPLPHALRQWTLALDPSRRPPWDVVAPLRPIAIRSYTRTTPRLFVEDPRGAIERRDEARYLPASFSATPEVLELMRVADGTHTVADLADAMDATSDDDRDMLVTALCTLWRNNALGWLPG